MGWWDDDDEEAREPFRREQGESVADCQGRAAAELAREPRSEVKEAWEDCEEPPAEPDPVDEVPIPEPFPTPQPQDPPSPL